LAHYAYVNDGIVTSVIVGPDEGTEPEGVTSWEDYFSAKGKGQAVRTSYNTRAGEHILGGEPFRFNYAGIGYTFDPDKGTDGAFIPGKPFESWVLDETTCLWVAPVDYPTDGLNYAWDEQTTSWVEVPGETV